MDNREERFLDYNNDNVFINLLQLETHLRNLDDLQTDESQVSCLTKHLAEAEGEALEAISHSATIASDKTPSYRRVRKRLNELRKSLPSYSPDKAILKIREIRKIVEKVVPRFNTEECVACGDLDEEVRKVFKSGSNNSFSKKNFGGQKMKARQVGLIGGSQFVGKLVTVLAEQADAMTGTVGAPAFARTSTWIDIGGGLAATLAGMLALKKNPDAQLALTVLGTHMLTKVVDVASEAMVPPTPVVSAAVAAGSPIGEVSGKFFQRELAPSAFEINGRSYAKDVFVD